MPDRGRSANFNPALPALGYPKNRVGIAIHPVWRESDQGDIRFKDWNIPLLPGTESRLGAWGESLAGLPSVYVPRWGYMGLDKQVISTTWAPRYREWGYSLTLSVAEDFLDWEGFEADSCFSWTGGINLKRFGTENERFITERESADISTEGFGFDLGWAGQIARIPYAPRLEATFGFSFLNLGPSIESAWSTDRIYGGSQPQEYRLGWSLEYHPLERIPWARRKWSLVRLTVTQEFRKVFEEYRREPDSRTFFAAFFSDFDKPPSRFWDETLVNMGAELNLGGVLNLRGGRGTSSFNWIAPTWSFGYGFNSGPLFKRLFFSYDYARVLSMGAARESGLSSGPSPREYGFQAGWFF